MAFKWTSPQPLVPNTTMLGVYLSKIQDTINLIRVHQNRPEIPWQLSTTGIFYYAHINNLRLWIDSLIVDFGYTSVVDILGRNWSTYEIFIPYIRQYAAYYRIIQDFRDVLDALIPSIEDWKSTVVPINVYSRIVPADLCTNSYTKYFYDFKGDLGFWRTPAFGDGFLNRESVTFPDRRIYDIATSMCSVYNERLHCLVESTSLNPTSITPPSAYEIQVQHGVSMTYFWLYNIVTPLHQRLILSSNDYFSVVLNVEENIESRYSFNGVLIELSLYNLTQTQAHTVRLEFRSQNFFTFNPIYVPEVDGYYLLETKGIQFDLSAYANTFPLVGTIFIWPYSQKMNIVSDYSKLVIGIDQIGIVHRK